MIDHKAQLVYHCHFLGKAPPPLYPIPQEEEDTPRTYRSDMPTQRNARNDKKNKKGEPEPENLILSHDESVQMLTKTFDFFHKAVVCFSPLVPCTGSRIVSTQDLI